jgi:hypothetical protein
MRKLEGTGSIHRVGRPSFLGLPYVGEAQLLANERIGPSPSSRPPGEGAENARRLATRLASAFPLQQAAAVVGGTRRGEAKERWRSRARGWPWSSSSASARLIASRLVGSFLLPSSPSPRPPTPRLAAGCFDPIGCKRNPIRCKLVRGERIRKG